MRKEDKTTFIGLVIIFSSVLISGAFISYTFGPSFYNAYQWRLTHTENCGYLNHCDNYNGTITFVRDYDVQCNTWWGAQGTCPREDVKVSVNGISFDQTVFCHFYRVGDSVTAQEKQDYYPKSNSTVISWSIFGGPC